MNDNQLFSSFMMLTEHLYEVFVQYIRNGRTRAPPETELIEIIPTFQFGAKTDRRAVQSKFKSWAKRMNFQNGALFLANTGKMIIPCEICDDLIMHLHSDAHVDIEDVIIKIRKTYTWTRKNFGMDRDIVVESIMRNCKKEECIKKMRLEIAKLGNSFCSGMPNFSLPEMISQMTFGLPPPLPYFPQYHFPLPVPIPPVFSPSRFPFHFPFLEDKHILKKSKRAINDTKDTFINKREDASNIVHEVNGNSQKRGTSVAYNASNDIEEITPVKFKKPKNVHEYKMLMEVARKSPKAFPDILSMEKNQFLSVLGIAPKIICGSRTLKKFRKELRHKQFMTRDCMIYRERKRLRDKNKLSKCLKKKKQHNYLGHTLYKKAIAPRSQAENLGSKQTQSKKTKEPVDEEKISSSSKKRVKLAGRTQKKEIEVITIECSDEEEKGPKDASVREGEAQEVGLKQGEGISSVQTDSNDTSPGKAAEKLSTIIAENVFNKPCQQIEKQTKSFGNLYDKEKEKLINRDNCGSERSRSKSLLLDKLRNTVLDENHISLSEKRVDPPPKKPSKSDSNNFAQGKYLPVSQLAVLQPTTAVTMVNNSVNCLAAAQLTPTSVVIRRTAHVLPKPPTPVTSSNQNNIKIVYPIRLTKATSSNIVFVEKKPKGAYFVVPPHDKSAFSHNLSIQPQGVPRSNASSRLRQLKPKRTNNESTGNHKKHRTVGDGSKIDINQEMTRIATWIYRMKSILNPCTLNNGEEKSVQKLLAQLDFGIHLVREAKKSLKEIEHVMDATESSKEHFHI